MKILLRAVAVLVLAGCASADRGVPPDRGPVHQREMLDRDLLKNQSGDRVLQAKAEADVRAGAEQAAIDRAASEDAAAKAFARTLRDAKDFKQSR